MSQEAAAAKARILVVDDNDENRELLEIILRAEGFELSFAASGEAALLLVAQQPPALILLDLMMPDMDGYEVARRIKRNVFTQHIPILMVTGLSEPSIKRLALAAGAQDLLAKPLDIPGLLMKIRSWLEAADRPTTPA